MLLVAKVSVFHFSYANHMPDHIKHDGLELIIIEEEESYTSSNEFMLRAESEGNIWPFISRSQQLDFYKDLKVGALSTGVKHYLQILGNNFIQIVFQFIFDKWMDVLPCQEVIHIEMVFTCLCFSRQEVVQVCSKLPSISHFIHKGPELTFSRTQFEVEVHIVSSFVECYVVSIKLKGQHGDRKNIHILGCVQLTFIFKTPLVTLFLKQSILKRREILKNWGTFRAR